MRTLLVILLLVCTGARSQLSDSQRKAISRDLRVKIQDIGKRIQYYDYMIPLWHRDRNLGLLDRYSDADTFKIVAHLHRDYDRLIDSLTSVERKKNPDGSYKKNPDGTFGWPWPSPFEVNPTEVHKHSPGTPDTMWPSRKRAPLVGT